MNPVPPDERAPGDNPGGAVTTSSSGEASYVAPDAYRALRFRGFRLLLVGGGIASFGQQMVAVALGWELYNRTNSALVLGGVGLAQIIPVMVLFLPAGQIADRYSRKSVVIVSLWAVVLVSLGLAGLSAERGPLFLIYACLVVAGGAQAFISPASSALIAQVIPAEMFENAMSWRSSVGQLSSVLGPAAGGLLIGLLHGATWIYTLNGGASLVFILLLLMMQVQPQKGFRGEKKSLSSLLGGLRFLGKTQVLLAAITLDLFAVLLGGATTLLPIFARDILHVGPLGLGWLQAATSLGAVGMALVLTHRPAFTNAGRTLLLAVTGFGLATIIFGLSSWFWLSFLMLVALGACDNISVVIRGTLTMVRTPDEMRGRVGAVTSLFIGTSNQLGGFESGLAAQLFGPVIAVAAGGVGTILVVLLVAWFWPEMRRMRTLNESGAM